MNKLRKYNKLVNKASPTSTMKRKERGKPITNKGLTKLHEDIVHAIETLNVPLFVDLGCTNIVNLNF